tara:strand:+ start:168 stop:566 length:399 start_codon:yes stop_codon:yes gene_type:complete
MDDAEICTICLEELEEDCYHDVATLSCSHKFHIMCILEWFQNKDINYCPLCVQQVSIQNIRRSRRGQEEHEHNKQIEENIIVIPEKNIEIISCSSSPQRLDSYRHETVSINSNNNNNNLQNIEESFCCCTLL